MEIPISNGINLLWGIINYQPSSYRGTLVYGNPISNGINLLRGIINYQPSSYWGTLVYGNPHFEWDKSAVGHYQLSTFKLLGYPRLWKSPFRMG